MSQNPSIERDLVDYSDLIDSIIPVSPHTIEANMSYNLVKTGRNKVKVNNQEWEIDVDSDEAGLYRLNAMTYYMVLTPYLILAKDLTSHANLFYLVKCKNHPHGWVQVDLDQGDNIYNIVKSPTST